MRNNFKYILITVLTIWSVQSHAQIDTRDSILVDGRWRTFVIHIPASINTVNRPLFLGFHAGGASQSTFGYQFRFNDKADAENFIAIFPEGVEASPGNRFWNAGTCCGDLTVDDVGFVDALLDTLINRYPVDTTRIYFVGASNGGMMCYRLALELNRPVAAIASVGGNCVVPGSPLWNIPILHISSFLDMHVPFFGGQSNGALSYPNQDSILQSWSGLYSCTSGKTILHDDSSDYQHFTYSGCNCNSKIEVYITYDGGHTWPAPWNPQSNSINATDTVWDFLSQYTYPCVTTGINEFSTFKEISVYPNPTNSTLFIKTKNPTSFQYSVTKSIGQMIKQGQLNGNSIDVSFLKTGIYFIRLKDEKGQWFHSKFIKE